MKAVDFLYSEMETSSRKLREKEYEAGIAGVKDLVLF